MLNSQKIKLPIRKIATSKISSFYQRGRSSHYDPTIGRWTTKDPIGFAGGDTNLYSYVGQNPMSYVDPEGTFALPAVAFLGYFLYGSLVDTAGQGQWEQDRLNDLSGFFVAGTASNNSFNPFKGKSPQQINDMFIDKGFRTSGPDPLNGRGGYINPRTGRSYHIDNNNRFGEPSHVDVNRSKYCPSNLEKRKFFIGE